MESVREHLTDFILENRLTYLNIKFQKGKLWTNTDTNNAKAQINYILMNKKRINSALHCETNSSFKGVSSLHRIVTAKICLRLHRNAKQTTRTARYNWSILNNRDISDKYTTTIRNKFDALQEISATLIPNEEYENMEVAAECITTKLRAKHRDMETLSVKKKRDDMKSTFLCNKRNPSNANAQKLKQV